jgi:hypothetical protein
MNCTLSEVQDEVRHAPLSSAKGFTPHLCRSCGADLLDRIYYHPRPDLTRLQAAMLAAKRNWLHRTSRDRALELAGIGLRLPMSSWARSGTSEGLKNVSRFLSA